MVKRQILMARKYTVYHHLSNMASCFRHKNDYEDLSNHGRMLMYKL